MLLKGDIVKTGGVILWIKLVLFIYVIRKMLFFVN
jgi:hypothetical protein